MLDVIVLSCWLDRQLRNAYITEIWIFGSVTRGSKVARDVDVLIQYIDENANEISQLRNLVRANFLKEFGTPLHLLCLSKSESEETYKFISAALQHAVRVR